MFAPTLLLSAHAMHGRNTPPWIAVLLAISAIGTPTHRASGWPPADALGVVEAMVGGERRASDTVSLWHVTQRDGGTGATRGAGWYRVSASAAGCSISEFVVNPMDVPEASPRQVWTWDAATGIATRSNAAGEIAVADYLMSIEGAPELPSVARLGDHVDSQRWWSGVSAAARLGGCAAFDSIESHDDGRVRVRCRGPLAKASLDASPPSYTFTVDQGGLRGLSFTPAPPESPTTAHFMGSSIEMDAPIAGCPLPAHARAAGSVYSPELPGTGVSTTEWDYQLLDWEPFTSTSDPQSNLQTVEPGVESAVFDMRGEIGYALGSTRARIDGVDYSIDPPTSVVVATADLLDRFQGTPSSAASLSSQRASSPIARALTEPSAFGRGNSRAIWLIGAATGLLGLGAVATWCARRSSRHQSSLNLWKRRSVRISAGLALLGVAAGAWWAASTRTIDSSEGGRVDLGTASSGAAGAELVREIHWTNSSDRPVSVVKCVADCSCLEVTPATRIANPGESIPIRFRMTLPRPGTRTVGVSLVLDHGPPVRWDIVGEATGSQPARLLVGNHRLQRSSRGRWDVLVPGTLDEPPALSLALPDGVMAQLNRARFLRAEPQSEPTAESRGQALAHWHLTLDVTVAPTAAPSQVWSPQMVRGVLADGRVFKDWFVIAPDDSKR